MSDSAASEHSWSPAADLVESIDAATQGWQQGDVAKPAVAIHVADAAQPLTAEAAELGGVGVKVIQLVFEESAVVTQTCDVVRSCAQRPTVQISPVVRLGGTERDNAHAGRIPRYAPVPGLGADAFADLDKCTTVEKTLLAGLDQERGCPDDHSLRAFSRAVARHRERFAFPDEWDRAAIKLKERMTKRAAKNSAEGRCVDAISQIRASAVPSWGAPDGYSVTIDFIIRAESLGTVDDASPDPQIMNWILTGQSIDELAGKLDELGKNASQATRSVLWMALAAGWAGLVTKRGPIADVTGLAESELVYSIYRHDHSAQMNFDHLTSGSEE